MATLGAPTTRAHIPDLLEANVRMAYVSGVSKMQKMYPRIYNVNPSTLKIERDVVVAGYGTYGSLPEGQTPTYDSIQEAWTKTYTPVGSGLGASFTRVSMQDDLHGVIRNAAQTGGALAKVAVYTMDLQAVTLFNSTLTSGTVYTAGGSNYSLISTTQYRDDGGTWSNRPADPMDFSIEALEYMGGHWMANQVNQRGQLTMVPPQRIMGGPGDMYLMQRIVNSVKRPQGNDNDPNPAGQDIKEVITHPLLTNDGRWLVFGAKEETGLNFFERWGPEVERWPDGANGNMNLVGWYRSIYGATHVENVWGSP